MKLALASLAPLQVPRVAVPKARQAEALATHALYRRSSQLLETLYQMSANAKVVNMKQNKSGRSCTDTQTARAGPAPPSHAAAVRSGV